MLNESNKKTIDDCLAKISDCLPGYKARTEQHKMMTEVAAALSRTTAIRDDDQEQLPIQTGESILVVEGPTGTGKSLGYLLPAIVVAKSFEKQLVVSSATVALQEQLAHKDIPFIAKHTGLKISYAIAKGRSRYVCPYRLYHHHNAAEQTDLFNDKEPISSSEQSIHIQQLTTKLQEGSWSGDRDSLQNKIPDAIWSKVTNDRHGCTKKRCAYYSACPFYKARAELEQVDIIIANHDLLLADIAMGAGTILPHPTDTFYCIDEAHHLADKAIKQFAASHSIIGTLAWLEKIEPVVARAMAILKDHPAVAIINTLTETIAEDLRELNLALGNIPELKPNPTARHLPVLYRCPQGVLPAEIDVLRENLATRSEALLSVIELLQDALRRKKQQPHETEHNPALQKVLSELGFLHGRTENMAAVWSLYSEQTPSDTAPIAKWFTVQLMKNNQIEYSINASRVRIAELLTKRFWQYTAGAILTSATLRTLNKFDLLLTETGLGNFPNITCLALESPFNLQQQATLVIPAMKTDPKDSVGHTDELIALLPTLINTNSNHGTLVLFASRKQMLDVAQALPKSLRELILMQNEEPKEILINKHFARISAKQTSILFGLASFAEGLDLPGDACKHVIIAKLPFAVPDEPVSLTLAEWIEERGGNAFQEITLPATSIKLIQAMGRLIRSETDTGTVTILDKRLKTKSYGKQLRNALPPFRVEMC